MKNIFTRVTQTTGQSGDLSDLEKDCLRTLQFDKDIVGDLVGSSLEGIDVRGENQIANMIVNFK